MKIAILGAGNVALANAWYLANEGHDVALGLIAIAFEDVDDLLHDLVYGHCAVASLEDRGGDGRQGMCLAGIGVNGDAAEIVKYPEFD